MRSFTLVLSLLCLGRLALAAPTGSGDANVDLDCLDQVTGRLTASPSTITAGQSLTLRWSVTAPPRCPVLRGVRVAGRAVGRSGTMVVAPESTRPYTLDAVLPGSLRTLAGVQVTVVPAFVTVSPTNAQAVDVAQFDAHWARPELHWGARENARATFEARTDNVWEIGERMRALGRMYELTRDPKYVAQLDDLAGIVLAAREDRRGASAQRDEFRGRVVPGWGVAGPTEAYHFRTDEVTSSVYAYSLAMLARIVAEDPALHQAYGPKAIAYANAVTETAWAFVPQLRDRPNGSYHEAWLAHLDSYATVLTAPQCDAAYDRERAADPGAAADVVSRLDQQRKNCKNLVKLAGRAMSHNENLAFQMVLMELYRALGSELYRQSTDRTTAGELLATFIPSLVARQHRFFVRHLELEGDRYRWDHEDELPSDVGPHTEDTNHGALDMRYHEMLRRDAPRLEVAATAAGEPILLDPVEAVRFARTFLVKIASGPDSHFNKNVDGEAPSDPYGLDSECDGWISLAMVDPAIWYVCRDASLRRVGNLQPHLTIGNHAALLWSKRYLPGWGDRATPPGGRSG